MHRTDAGVIGRILSTLALMAALAAVGCRGNQTIRGKVIPGTVGLAVAADPGDERLELPGVEGIEVALLRDAGHGSPGGGVITKDVSDELGNFEITLRRGQHPAGPVIIRTQGPGVYLSRTRAYLPRGSQRLLCTVIEIKEPSGP